MGNRTVWLFTTFVCSSVLIFFWILYSAYVGKKSITYAKAYKQGGCTVVFILEWNNNFNDKRCTVTQHYSSGTTALARARKSTTLIITFSRTSKVPSPRSAPGRRCTACGWVLAGRRSSPAETVHAAQALCGDGIWHSEWPVFSAGLCAPGLKRPGFGEFWFEGRVKIKITCQTGRDIPRHPPGWWQYII